MDGSGHPIPPPDYVTEVSERYISPATPFFSGQPTFPVTATNPLFTPEGFYPTTLDSPVKSLEWDTSVAQGVSILNSTIVNQIAGGKSLVVLGYSQSSTISSLEMGALLALPKSEQPTADQLSFVLIGDLNNPDGGLLARFDDPSLPPLTFPSLGITFSGATPADTPWETAIYTQEYDGYADFPRYPIDLLADANALLGTAVVHNIYPTLTAAQLASAELLPVSDDYTGHTQYFMIPTQDLPLLSLVRAIH
ncbi:MAG: PE-PPE domain-containing protein, partial [Mycobacterium sp.]